MPGTPSRNDVVTFRSLSVTFGGIAWMLSVWFFVAEILTRAAWTIPYDWTDRFLSDLGNTSCQPFRYYTTDMYLPVCSPRHALMNGSFILLGVLLGAGLTLTRRAWPPGRGTVVGRALVAWAAVSWIMVGLAPENENIVVHGLGAMGIFVVGNAGVLVLGFATRGAPEWRVPAVLGLLLGAFGLVMSILFLCNQFLGLGLGTMERLAIYPLIVWAATAGAVMIAGRRR